MKNIIDLVLWSGGLDSTVLLYELLSKTQRPIHAHFVYLKTTEKRYDAENKAVDSLLPLLQKIRPFEFSYSIIDYSTRKFVVMDVFNYLLMAHNIGCGLNYKKVRACFAWIYGGNSSYVGERDLAYRIRDLWSVYSRGTPLLNKLYTPYIGVSKQEIFNKCPDNIRQLSWSCRQPIKTENGFVRCNKCFTCKELNQLKGEL